jgi:hypothetical protein
LHRETPGLGTDRSLYRTQEIGNAFHALGMPKAAAHAAWVCGSAVAFGWRLVKVTDRVHPFVQHTDDLDHAFLGSAIVENVNWSPDLCAFRTVGMSEVKAADTTGTKFRALPCEQPFGLIRDLSHCGGENSGVPLPTAGTPAFGTCRKDIGQIDQCWTSEPKPRHAD